MSRPWLEGARLGSLPDECPKCKLAGVLVYDFQKFGKHSFAYCSRCQVIYVDGKVASPVVTTEKVT